MLRGEEIEIKEPSYRCAYSEIEDVFKLVPNPRNPNTHPEKQIEMLAKIINYQGQRRPVVVSKRSGFITKGHGALMAMKLIEWDKVAVDYQDYDSEEQEYADMKADNEIQAYSKLDKKKDKKNIAELDFEPDFDFELTGVEEVIKQVEKAQDDIGESIGHSSGKILHTCPKCQHQFHSGAKK